ncbi:MAG: hypothetical protein ACKVK0_07550 [Pirellulales bacterium]|jgi:hypothetical protein|tara:strand:- start:426 stop:602 length:177 start_codon:yes stop_codon:yes gene_type:complete
MLNSLEASVIGSSVLSNTKKFLYKIGVTAWSMRDEFYLGHAIEMVFAGKESLLKITIE